MQDKVKVIRKDGSVNTLPEWQKFYGLTVGSTAIGKHFFLTEYRFKKDIEDFGELIIYEDNMILMDAYRIDKGSSVTVNSFNRTAEKQAALAAQGLRTATFSPHEVKMAADIDTPGINDLFAANPLNKLTNVAEWVITYPTGLTSAKLAEYKKQAAQLEKIFKDTAKENKTTEGHIKKIWTLAVQINRAEVERMKKIAKSKGITIRIGNEEYLRSGQTFFHFDICPMWFAPGKPKNKEKHPAAWEKATTW